VISHLAISAARKLLRNARVTVASGRLSFAAGMLGRGLGDADVGWLSNRWQLHTELWLLLVPVVMIGSSGWIAVSLD
jgi:hypothetical protein